MYKAESYQPSKQSPPNQHSHTGAVTTTHGDTQTLIQGLTYPLITGRTQSQASSGRHITAVTPPPQRGHVQTHMVITDITHTTPIQSLTHPRPLISASLTHTPRPHRGCICKPRSGEPWSSLSPTHFGLNTLVFLSLSHTHILKGRAYRYINTATATSNTRTHNTHWSPSHRHCHTISHAGHTNMLAVSHTHTSPPFSTISQPLPGPPALADLSHTRFEHTPAHPGRTLWTFTAQSCLSDSHTPIQPPQTPIPLRTAASAHPRGPLGNVVRPAATAQRRPGRGSTAGLRAARLGGPAWPPGSDTRPP